jgi:predicted membrane protein
MSKQAKLAAIASVLLVCSQDSFFCVFMLAPFTYIGLFFMVNILRTKSINQMTEYSNTKKKYLIIKKCIENEIVRRKDNPV